jgi:hypothetical protein
MFLNGVYVSGMSLDIRISIKVKRYEIDFHFFSFVRRRRLLQLCYPAWSYSVVSLPHLAYGTVEKMVNRKKIVFIIESLSNSASFDKCKNIKIFIFHNNPTTYPTWWS